MIYGSHNSWSFLKPKHWWLRPFAFTARCQNIDIEKQYLLYDVRCFDLIINFDKKGELYICHGPLRYKYTEDDLIKDLTFLNNRTEQCYIRILYDVRTKNGYTEEEAQLFRDKCKEYEEMFPRLTFWCGRNIVNWTVEYDFSYKPKCIEKYSSVCPPKYLDDWYPWIYAKINNKKIKQMKLDADILLFDFVNIV